MSEPKHTPWQRVLRKFGGNQSDLAEAIGRHRSKISRVINSADGLINGADQKLLLEVAERQGVKLTSEDLLP